MGKWAAASKHNTDSQRRPIENNVNTMDFFERSLIPIPYGLLPNFSDELFSNYVGLVGVTIGQQRCSLSQAFKGLELDSLVQPLRTHQHRFWPTRLVAWLFNVGDIRDKQRLYRCYQYQEWLQKMQRVRQEGLILQRDYHDWIRELQHASPSWRQPALWEYLCYGLMRMVSTKPEETLIRWLDTWGDTRHSLIGQWIKSLLIFTFSGVCAYLLGQWLNKVEQDIKETAAWNEHSTEEEYNLSLIIQQAEQLQVTKDPWLTEDRQPISNLDPSILYRSYKKLTLRFHPDKGWDAKRFEMFNQAKERLDEGVDLGYRIGFDWLRREVQKRQEADKDNTKWIRYELEKKSDHAKVTLARKLRGRNIEGAKDVLIIDELRAENEKLSAEYEILLTLLRKSSPELAEEFERRQASGGTVDSSGVLVCYASPIHSGSFAPLVQMESPQAALR